MPLWTRNPPKSLSERIDIFIPPWLGKIEYPQLAVTVQAYYLPAKFHAGRLLPAVWSIAPPTALLEVCGFENLAPGLIFRVIEICLTNIDYFSMLRHAMSESGVQFHLTIALSLERGKSATNKASINDPHSRGLKVLEESIY